MSIKELRRRLDAIDEQIDATMYKLDELQAQRDEAYEAWMKARAVKRKCT